jgi:hypothetical protein
MIVAVIMAVSLDVATFLFHHAVLRWLSGGMAHIAMTAGIRVLTIVLVALIAHVVELAVYAGAYALGAGALSLGDFGRRTHRQSARLFLFFQ